MLLAILEGLERTGKTTLAQMLLNRWRKNATRIKVEFPEVLEMFGEVLARQMWAGMHVRDIMNNAKIYRCMIIDRGFISNVVYGINRIPNSFNRGIDLNVLATLSKKMDVLVFYLDAPDDVLATRHRDNKPFLAGESGKMRELYNSTIKIAEDAGIKVVRLDASEHTETLAEEVEWCARELTGWEPEML